MKWPWQKEHRASLTDLVVQSLVDTATGATTVPDGLAALEVASGLWGRAFSSAQVSPSTIATESVTPDALMLIGRQLVRRGEAVFELRVERGRLRLVPVSDWDVTGSHDPETWVYQLSLPGPSTTTTKTVVGEKVLHVRVNQDPAEPWKGRSPVAVASATSKTAANLELRLGQELSAQVGNLLPVPGDPQESRYDKLRNQLGSLLGRAALVPSQDASWTQEPAGTGRQEWVPRRMGAAPPETIETIRGQSAAQILGACGCPVTALESADGTSLREYWRQFLHGTIAPVATVVEQELSLKLGTGVSLGFDKLMASDVVGKARALGTLVTNGVPLTEAMKLTGFEDD